VVKIIIVQINEFYINNKIILNINIIDYLNNIYQVIHVKKYYIIKQNKCENKIKNYIQIELIAVKNFYETLVTITTVENLNIK